MPRFQNLVLRVCEAVSENLTATRLNKLLWLVDKAAFPETGRKITGHAYLRKVQGPVPRDNGKELAMMKESGQLEIRTSRDEQSGLSKREYKALAPADMSVFTEVEREIIDPTLREYATWPTYKLVSLAHDLVWANREDGEEINFDAYRVKFNFSRGELDAIKKHIEDAELAYEA